MASNTQKFHVENGVIITTKEEVSVQHVFNYLTENLDKFKVGSEFITVCGVHGGERGELLRADKDFRYDYEMMYRWFKNHRKYGKQAKMVEDRNYVMETVLEVSSKLVDTRNGKYLLLDDSKAKLKTKFEKVLAKQVPMVLILASCFSFKSQICNILRSTGLLTVFNVLEERGEITNGNMFLLDPEQQEFFKIISDEELDIKDVIVGGITFLHNLLIQNM